MRRVTYYQCIYCSKEDRVSSEISDCEQEHIRKATEDWQIMRLECPECGKFFSEIIKGDGTYDHISCPWCNSIQERLWHWKSYQQVRVIKRKADGTVTMVEGDMEVHTGEPLE